MHDHARRSKTRIHDSHILHAGLLPDTAKNSRRISYPHEALILLAQVNLTCPSTIYFYHFLYLDVTQEDL